MKRKDILNLKPGDLVRLKPTYSTNPEDGATIARVLSLNVRHAQYGGYGKPLHYQQEDGTIREVRVRDAAYTSEPDGSAVLIQVVREISPYAPSDDDWNEYENHRIQVVRERGVVSRWDDDTEATFVKCRAARRAARERQERQEEAAADRQRNQNREALRKVRDLVGPDATLPAWAAALEDGNYYRMPTRVHGDTSLGQLLRLLEAAAEQARS